jgi:sterol 24-C-methyltransferase
VPEAEAEHRRRVVGYYHKPESRLSYRLLLGGTKHFGYYPSPSGGLSMGTAMRRMEDKLGATLDLLVGARVPAGSPRFHRADYADLPFPDQSFDGAYTLETLVHAFDHRRALRELGRVLKPGGRLVLFEYSVPPRTAMTPAERDAFDLVVEASAMRSLPWFVHGGFPAMLEAAGFEVVSEEDISERMWPMLRRLARICLVPAELGRLLGARRALLNCTAAVESWRHRHRWRYNVVVARLTG